MWQDQPKIRRGVGRVTSAITAVALFSGGAVSMAGAEAIEIKPNLEVGQTFNQRVSMNQDIEQSFMGNTMNITMDMRFDFSTEVLEETEPGVYRLKMTYDRVEAMADGPMGAGRWESGDPPPMNPMLSGFAAMDGMELTYDMDESGKASNVEGTEAMLEKAMQGVPENMRPMMRETLGEQFSNEQMAAMINMGGVLYPGKPVDVGESWTGDAELGGMMPLSISSELTLTDSDAQTATVEIAGSMKTPDGAAMTIGPGMEAEMKMDGGQNGTVVFNRDTGWADAMEMTQSFEGQLTMPNPTDPNGPEMTIPMKVDIDLTLETLD
ncbi:MAG: DUF6263 family protein [Planctomycetota bacterium]